MIYVMPAGRASNYWNFNLLLDNKMLINTSNCCPVAETASTGFAELLKSNQQIAFQFSLKQQWIWRSADTGLGISTRAIKSTEIQMCRSLMIHNSYSYVCTYM